MVLFGPSSWAVNLFTRVGLLQIHEPGGTVAAAAQILCHASTPCVDGTHH